MSCDCTEKVSLLIDGELPENEARVMQRHLLQCFDCQQAQKDFLSLRSQIGAYVPQLEPVTQRETLNRIVNRKPVKVRAARPAWSWSFSPRVAAFAALVMVAAIAGLLFYRSLNLKQGNTNVAQLQKTKAVEQPTVEHTATPKPAPTTSPAPSATPTPAAPSPAKAPRLRPRRSEPVLPEGTFASNGSQRTTTNVKPDVRSADTQTLMAMHFEKSELLLRAFRNVRPDEPGSATEVEYEKKQAKQLVLQNMMLRREADTAGDVQVASLLENLEPILLDIANLPRKPAADEIEVIKERVERKNIVALLQVNSTALARALD
jgi:negative regulator of sigma E activity